MHYLHDLLMQTDNRKDVGIGNMTVLLISPLAAAMLLSPRQRGSSTSGEEERRHSWRSQDAGRKIGDGGSGKVTCRGPVIIN